MPLSTIWWAIAVEYPRLDKNREHLVNKEAGQPKRPSRRRWRGVAVAASAVLLLGGGYATANAATRSDTGKRTTAPRPQIRNATGVAKVVNAANAFVDTLSAD